MPFNIWNNIYGIILQEWDTMLKFFTTNQFLFLNIYFLSRDLHIRTAKPFLILNICLPSIGNSDHKTILFNIDCINPII